MNALNRTIALLVLIGLAVHAGRQSVFAADQAPGKPNIIVILADDVGYADLSVYPGGRFPTPNIDRLGQGGVTFTDGYATAAICAPSRAGLMTGRQQQRFGFEYNNGPAKRDVRDGLGLPKSEITIAQLLKNVGYHTGMIGKWHLGSGQAFYPTNRGFDDFVGFLPGETSYIDPTLPGVHMSYGPLGDDLLGLAIKVKNAAEGLDEDLGLPPSAKVMQAFYRSPLNQIVEGPDRQIVHNENQYLTDYFADRAVGYIARMATSGQPYFLYLAVNAAHAPHMVTDRYYQRFPDIGDHQLRVYAAMIAALDDAVGRVLDAVDQSGQAANTIVYFASDNGCAAYFSHLCSCQPLRGGKLTHFEGGIRVPFLMRWPGRIAPGSVYHQPVSLLDVLPTSVAAAGGRLPGDRAYDGVDLLPYLAGQSSGAPHDLLAWRREPLVAIRQGDWKLSESRGGKDSPFGSYRQLFNLREDLNETTDLALGRQSKIDDLEGLLRQWEKPMIAPSFPSKPPVTYDVCGTKLTLPQ